MNVTQAQKGDQHEERRRRLDQNMKIKMFVFFIVAIATRKFTAIETKTRDEIIEDLEADAV